MLSVSDTSPMPRSSRSSAVVISFFSERASRSSFHTTSTSSMRGPGQHAPGIVRNAGCEKQPLLSGTANRCHRL